MFPVDVLHGFVLKFTEGKPHVQEHPSSAVITNGHLVREQLKQVGYPLKGLDLLMLDRSSALPSCLRHLAHGHVPSFLQLFFLSLPLPLTSLCVLGPRQAPACLETSGERCCTT